MKRLMLLAAGAALFLSPSWTRAADWQPNAAMMALYEKAKAEKEVSLWTPAAIEGSWVNDQFAKRFPGITVNLTPDLQGATKMIAEARAGRHTVDDWTFALGGMLEVQKRGLMAQEDWAKYGIDPKDTFFDGQAAATHNFIYTTVYSKAALKPADLPKTWEDLTDPKWTGKLVAQSFLLPRMMGFFALEWGPERAEKWGHTLIDDRKMLIINGSAEPYLKSGECVMSVGDSISLAYQYRDDGLDVAYRNLDLVPAGQFAVTVLKDAPHPNAALLLAAWLSSEEGRDLYDKLIHETDIRPGSKAALATEIRQSGAKVILEDPSTMAQRAKYYESFSKLVRGQK